jgi:hypothetical protein
VDCIDLGLDTVLRTATYQVAQISSYPSFMRPCSSTDVIGTGIQDVRTLARPRAMSISGRGNLLKMLKETVELYESSKTLAGGFW